MKIKQCCYRWCGQDGFSIPNALITIPSAPKHIIIICLFLERWNLIGYWLGRTHWSNTTHFGLYICPVYSSLFRQSPSAYSVHTVPHSMASTAQHHPAIPLRSNGSLRASSGRHFDSSPHLRAHLVSDTRYSCHPSGLVSSRVWLNFHASHVRELWLRWTSDSCRTACSTIDRCPLRIALNVAPSTHRSTIANLPHAATISPLTTFDARFRCANRLAAPKIYKFNTVPITTWLL